jgi:hypothetical protein
MYTNEDLWELRCQEHEEMLERDTNELFSIARAFINGNPHRDWFSITDRDGSKITVKLEDANKEMSSEE